MDLFKKYSNRSLLLSALILPGFIAGCGGGGSSTVPSVVTTTPVEVTTAETPSSGGGGSSADTTAPSSSVTTATIADASTGNAVVQSTETGTAYLVNTSVVVTNLASITGSADNLWNQVAIATANTNTNLATTGLINGTYKVYTVDAAGNLSGASANTITISSIMLTTAADSGGIFSGTVGDDVFIGTFTDGDAASTFNATDILIGAGGTDTLKIYSNSVGAMTLTGASWNAGDSGLETLVIGNTAAGAIGLTSGANFIAAFNTNLVLTTTGAAACPTTIVLTGYPGTATITSTVTGAGLIDITAGAGATTVSATNTAAGGETVNGTGLTSVNITSGGAGAQNVGTVGLTPSLATVTLVQNAAGDQTVTSTNAAAVTVSATITGAGASGAQTITTAGGADTISLLGTYLNSIVTVTAGAGADTINLLSGHTGVNTIMETTASTGLPTTVNFDTVVNYNKALDNIGCTNLIMGLQNAGAGSGVATIGATGIATFHGDDTTFALHLAAVIAGLDSGGVTAGQTAIWQEGADSFIYISDGTAGASGTDVLIKLTGVTAGALTIGGNKITVIA